MDGGVLGGRRPTRNRQQADVQPVDLVNEINDAAMQVRPEFLKDAVRRRFPNVPDFDAKYAEALNILSKAKVSEAGNDIFGRSLKESRGFGGFLRAIYSIGKPAVEAVRDPTKAPEILRQQFERLVVPNVPQALQQPLRQGAQLAEKGIKSDMSKKLESA